MKKQKGYTLTELLIVISFGTVLLFVLFFISAVIYALGKYLFGWWG